MNRRSNGLIGSQGRKANSEYQHPQVRNSTASPLTVIHWESRRIQYASANARLATEPEAKTSCKTTVFTDLLRKS